MFRWFYDLTTSRILLVEIPLCRRHLVICRLLTLFAWLAFPIGLSLLLFPVGEQLHLWGPVIGFCIGVILIKRPRPVKAVHAGIGHVTLAGVGDDYLRSLSPARAGGAPSVTDILNSTQTLRERVAANKRSQ